jgi:hypothetical protein
LGGEWLPKAAHPDIAAGNVARAHHPVVRAARGSSVITCATFTMGSGAPLPSRCACSCSKA